MRYDLSSSIDIVSCVTACFQPLRRVIGEKEETLLEEDRVTFCEASKSTSCLNCKYFKVVRSCLKSAGSLSERVFCIVTLRILA